MSKIKSRILQLIESKGISKREFCRQIDVSHTYLNGDSEVGSDKLEMIISVFPELSLEWLLLGKGEMTKGNLQNSADVEKLYDTIHSNARTIENMSATIVDLTKLLSQKGGAADVPGAVGMAAKG